MIIVKLLMLVRYVVSKTILFIYIIIKWILRMLFFKPLVKLYYIIFRLKKSGVVDNSLERTIRKNMGSFLVMSLIIIVVGLNVFTKKTYADTSKLSQTIIASLIQNEFSAMNEEELITQTAMKKGDISVGQYFSPDNAIKKPSEAWKDENSGNDGWLTMSMIKDSGTIDSNQAVSMTETPASSSAVSGQTAPAKRTEIITYTVATGDTISSIARRFGININTVLWSNNLSAYSLIKPGDSLTILPVSGWIYKVKSGDVLGKLASTYGVSVNDIMTANNLSSASLRIGQSIIIPGDKKPVTTAVASAKPSTSTSIPPQSTSVTPPSNATEDAGGKMLWPTVGHRITQYYSLKHTGLDIANKIGTPIYAAEAGTVIHSSWSTGYGYNVVIDHGNGYKTRYAHSSKLEVSVGDKVVRGQEIMKMGSTGWSTGPHLHFEVIVNGVRKNPLNYIK